MVTCDLFQLGASQYSCCVYSKYLVGGPSLLKLRTLQSRWVSVGLMYLLYLLIHLFLIFKDTAMGSYKYVPSVRIYRWFHPVFISCDQCLLNVLCRQAADVLFFVIDSQTRSIASLVEAAYLAGNSSRQWWISDEICAQWIISSFTVFDSICTSIYIPVYILLTRFIDSDSRRVGFKT